MDRVFLVSAAAAILLTLCAFNGDSKAAGIGRDAHAAGAPSSTGSRVP